MLSTVHYKRSELITFTMLDLCFTVVCKWTPVLYVGFERIIDTSLNIKIKLELFGLQKGEEDESKHCKNKSKNFISFVQ